MSRCAKRVFSHPRGAAPLALVGLRLSDATIIKALRTELASNPGAWSHYQRNKTTITLIMSQLAALIKKNQIDGACGWLDTIAKQCLDGQATNLHLDGPVGLITIGTPPARHEDVCVNGAMGLNRRQAICRPGRRC